MKINFDAYTRRARIAPALLVVLPLSFAALAWFPASPPFWGVLSSLAVASGGTLLLSEIGRDKGKDKEPALFSSWGGKPSVRLLRHRHAANRALVQRRHKRLAELVPETEIPTPEQEDADPDYADEVYESLCAFLREKTRDRRRVPLLFEELCSYGFRRNLWGMKPLGVTASVVGIAGIGFLLLLNHRSGVESPPLVYASGLGAIVFLLGWLFWFTPKWVRIPAEAYAERLLAACDEL